jgi:hypothetical protein
MVVASYIFSPIRNYFLVRFPFAGRLLSCIQCFGFWSGLVIYLLCKFGILDGRFLSTDTFSDFIAVEAILYGLVASLASVFFNSVIFFLNTKDTYIISKNQHEDDENN